MTISRSNVARAVLSLLVALAAAPGCGSKGDGGTGGVDMSGPPGALAVWTAGVSRKIQPTTAVGTEAAVQVASTRQAWASYQLVVRGKGGWVGGVKVALSGDLSDGGGHTLGKENVTFFREHYIDLGGITANTGTQPVPQSSPTGDTRVPDPLVPLVDPYTGNDAGQPFAVGADLNQPVFVDVHVPAGTAAGTYTGTIEISSDQGSARVPISVTAWNVDLPDMRTVTTHFKMSIEKLYQYHSGLEECSDGSCYLAVNDRSREVIKRYEELAHAHRIDTAQQLADAPVNGCSPPSSSDWADYDAKMAPYFDGSYFSDGVPSGRLEAPFSPGQTFGVDGACGPTGNSPDQTKYAAVSKAWSDHLRTKSWLQPSVVYALDEPEASDLPGIVEGSQFLQAGDPAWKPHVMLTHSPDASELPTLSPAIGIFTVALPWYDDWAGNHAWLGRKDWPGLIAQGTELWFYTSNSTLPPYPTISTNTLDAFEPLIQMWGAWYEQATGFLYWDISSWDDMDPWGPETTWGIPGDGVFVYPGNHDGSLSPAGSPSGVAIDGPIPSYRLKMLRQGLQDWALFRLADQMGKTAAAQQAVSTVYTQLGGCDTCPMPASGFYWKTDEAAIDAARAAVVQALIQ